jgi:isopenicillin N synthase-like dioxygenase
VQVHHTGFFSVTGTGFTQEEVDRQYDIGQAYFDLPLQEKGDPKYRCDFAQGNYFGYRAVNIRTPLYHSKRLTFISRLTRRKL